MIKSLLFLLLLLLLLLSLLLLLLLSLLLLVLTEIFEQQSIVDFCCFTNAVFVDFCCWVLPKYFHQLCVIIIVIINIADDNFYIRVNHDGKGITQEDFEIMNKSSVGLGLKNIQSRMKVLNANIHFEKDPSQTFYKVTIELPLKTGKLI